MSGLTAYSPGEWRIEPGDPGDRSVGLGPVAPSIVAAVPEVEGEEVEICILREPVYRVDPNPNDEYDEGLRASGTIEDNAALIIAAPSLLRFKRYVHARLDAAGVTVDPDSPHKAEGCRIGGRLDELIGERDRLRAELAAIQSAASAVLFFRHASGEFVDGFMAQEKLNDLAAQFPDGYQHWPGALGTKAA